MFSENSLTTHSQQICKCVCSCMSALMFSEKLNPFLINSDNFHTSLRRISKQILIVNQYLHSSPLITAPHVVILFILNIILISTITNIIIDSTAICGPWPSSELLDCLRLIIFLDRVSSTPAPSNPVGSMYFCPFSPVANRSPFQSVGNSLYDFA
jgi:hypothetical protein